MIPKVENIHQKIYAAASAENALDMKTWHICETTHCRAGWAVHLAGEEGYALEKATSPCFAAMMIYKASGEPIAPTKLFLSNAESLADMKACAEKEVEAL